MEITKTDIKKIKELANNPHIYNKLIKSTAPTITGYNSIKESLILSLIMGVQKQSGEYQFNAGINLLIIGSKHSGKDFFKEFLKKFGIKNKFEIINNIREENQEEIIVRLKNNKKSVIAFTEFKDDIPDRYNPMEDNISLPYSLLNCFDLIFPIENRDDDKLRANVADTLLNLNMSKNTNNNDIIDSTLLKKFIVYTNIASKPKLTEESNKVIKDYFTNTDISEYTGYFDMSYLVVESLIRLAEASAKIRLKETVDKEDAEKAVRLYTECLCEMGVIIEIDETDIYKTDIDIIKSSPSTLNIRDRDVIQYIMDEIKLLEEEYVGDAPLNVLISNLDEKYNIPEDKVKQFLKILVKKGVIYQPITGYYRRIL